MLCGFLFWEVWGWVLLMAFVLVMLRISRQTLSKRFFGYCECECLCMFLWSCCFESV